MSQTVPSTDSGAEDPIGHFGQCHAGNLERLARVQALPAAATAAVQAIALAQDMLALFGDGVAEHHSEEERDLFPAVLRSAQPGIEAAKVQEIVDRLTREHRQIERLWDEVASSVKAVSKGRFDAMDPKTDGARMSELATRYGEHARYEEAQFLPLAEQILGRNGNHMAALGLTLHMRHVRPVHASYI